MGGLLWAAEHRREPTGPFRFLDFRDATIYPDGGMSAASYLAKSGLTFTNATAAGTFLTVETNTGPFKLIDRIGANTPRFGTRTDNAHRGQRIEGERTNLWIANRDTTQPAWQPGSVAAITGQVGPDGGINGNNAVRFTLGAGGFSKYEDIGPPFIGVVQVWTRNAANIGTGLTRSNQDTAPNTFVFRDPAGSPVWVRFEQAPLQFGTCEFIPVDGQPSAHDGGIPFAPDNIIDFPQVEAVSTFGSSAIETPAATAGTRRADFTRDATLAHWVQGGRLPFECNLVPAADYASFDFSAPIVLWWIDANNNCQIQATSGILAVRVAGVTQTLGAITFQKNDILNIFVAAGGGQPTVAWYRKNLGPAQPLGTQPALAAIASGLPIFFLSDGVVTNFYGELQTLASWA